MDEREELMIERLGDEAQDAVDAELRRKDVRERRTIAKDHLYAGSKKLKHSAPKGKNP